MRGHGPTNLEVHQLAAAVSQENPPRLCRLRWMMRSPTLSVRLMATPADYAGGGTEILTEGRVSIFSWKASSFG